MVDAARRRKHSISCDKSGVVANHSGMIAGMPNHIANIGPGAGIPVIACVLALGSLAIFALWLLLRRSGRP